MKFIIALIAGPVLLLIGIIQYEASNHTFLDTGKLIRSEKEIVLTKKIKVEKGMFLKEVSFLIWQRRLDGISVWLESPDGIRIELTRSNGKYGYWYKNTVLSDDADSLIYTAKHPFEGTYRPHQFLAWVNQGDMNGKWKLIIRNRHPFSRTGAVVYWKLKFDKDVKPLQSIKTSPLPVLSINTDDNKAILDEKKTKADIYIFRENENIYTKPADRSVIRAKLKVRGFSSRQLPKKSYAIDLIHKTDSGVFRQLGLPVNTEWILSSNFMEKSMIRNQIVYDLYHRAGYDNSRGRHVEVILNGAYIGVYMLQPKINPSPAMLTDVWNNPKGFMVKIDSPVDNKPGFYNTTIGWDAEHYIYYQYVYPDADDLKEGDSLYIKNRILEFEKSLLNSSSADRLDKFMDVRSFADYLIFEEFTKNNDGYNLSCYLHTDANNRIVIGPVWDFDRSLGNSTSGFTRSVEGWKIGTHKQNEYHPVPLWWRTLLRNEQFKATVKERWKELSTGIFSEEQLMRSIDSLSGPLNAVQGRNFKVWPVWGISRSNFYTNPAIKNYGDEIEDLKSWIRQRRNWMDTELKKETIIFYHDT